MTDVTSGLSGIGLNFYTDAVNSVTGSGTDSNKSSFSTILDSEYNKGNR